MKVFVTTLLAVAVAGSAFAQGTVSFRNRIAGSMFTPVYGPSATNPLRTQQGNSPTNQFTPGSVDYTGHTLLAGAGFTAALFGGPVGTAPEQLSFVQSSTFNTGANLAGIWVNVAGLAPAIPGAPPNGNAPRKFALGIIAVARSRRGQPRWRPRRMWLAVCLLRSLCSLLVTRMTAPSFPRT
jgi:hypothetical protein